MAWAAVASAALSAAGQASAKAPDASSSFAQFSGDIRVGGLNVNVPNYRDPVFESEAAPGAFGGSGGMIALLLAGVGYAAYRLVR